MSAAAVIASIRAGSAASSPASSPARAAVSVPRARPRASASSASASTCAVNVFVAATPISMPARVNSTASASRVACEPITFVIVSTVAPDRRAMTHGRERVRGLSRLCDAEHQIAQAEGRIAVAVFRGDLELDGMRAHSSIR